MPPRPQPAPNGEAARPAAGAAARLARARASLALQQQPQPERRSTSRPCPRTRSYPTMHPQPQLHPSFCHHADAAARQGQAPVTLLLHLLAPLLLRRPRRGSPAPPAWNPPVRPPPPFIRCLPLALQLAVAPHALPRRLQHHRHRYQLQPQRPYRAAAVPPVLLWQRRLARSAAGRAPSTPPPPLTAQPPR